MRLKQNKINCNRTKMTMTIVEKERRNEERLFNDFFSLAAAV
jgi:hypothetical protein